MKARHQTKKVKTMIQKIYPLRPSLLAALLCGAAAMSASAQAPGAPGPLTTPPPLLPLSSPPPPPPQMHHMSARPNPLFDALDTNHDGIISAEEIANASVSLKALLKNGSDHLTREDLRPSGPPPGMEAPGHPTADEAGQPRPKIPAIRPHGPPVREDEESTEGPETRPMHPPKPGDDRADEDSARPYGHHEAMQEFRRHFHGDEEAMDDDVRPQHQHERMSRREHLPRPENDEMDGPPPRHPEAMREERDARPHHPEAMREDEETRPHHPPRPENAGESGDAPPRAHGPMHEEAGPREAHHGPPPMPLFDALDANHDGTISAEEIANAPALLKGLLKNGSDHLTREDLRPAAPPQGER